LIVTGIVATLPVASASCERSFSKTKLVKTFLRNYLTTETLGNTDLLSVERYELKNRFRWFRWWISQSTIKELSYIEVMMIFNSNVDCAGSCARIIFLIDYLPESV